MRTSIAVLAWVATVAVPLRAIGYQEDVHYGLTKWLAIKAGFSRQDAERVADFDRTVDGNALDAVRLVAYSACVGRDEVGARLVREHHFPTTGGVPGKPSTRSVAPGSSIARQMVKDRTDNPATDPGSGREYNLEAFGVGLHRLQDSYSHQGEPDIPTLHVVSCKSEYAWGHPATRKGWRSHDADITHIYPSDAIAMARDTYESMCRYATKVLRLKKCAAWATLEPQVKEFVQASTKQDKLRWFQSTMPDVFDCDFLRNIDLDNGRAWRCGRRVQLAAITEIVQFAAGSGGPTREAARASDPTAFVEATLRTWFVDRNLDVLTANFADVSTYQVRSGLPIMGNEDFREALTKRFALALVDDRATVHESLYSATRLAENFTISRQFGADGTSFATLRAANPAVAFKAFPDLASALNEVTPDHRLFRAEEVPCLPGIEGPCAIAGASPKDAPYQDLILEFRKIKGEWQLVGDHRLSFR